MALGYHKVKPDANQLEIIDTLRANGAFIINCTPVKNAFDLLVVHNGVNYICEVKNKNGKLSDGELKCKEGVEKAGGVYHIVKNKEEALKIIGL